MVIERVVMWSQAREQLLVLRERDGHRRLAFITGYFEASALWWFLKGEQIPRPSTFDAWINTIVALGWQVGSACVIDRSGETYFAEIRLFCERASVAVDVRPSDAVIFALRAGVPLFFKEKVLAAYGVHEPEPE
jgi:uncharacterized protein